MRIKVRLQLSYPDSEAALNHRGTKEPDFGISVVDTSVETMLSQTQVLCGMTTTLRQSHVDPETKQESTSVEEFASYVLVTPEIVAAAASKPADAGQSNR